MYPHLLTLTQIKKQLVYYPRIELGSSNGLKIYLDSYYAKKLEK